MFTILVSTLTAAVVGALAFKAGHAVGQQQERQQAAADRAALGLGAAAEVEQIRRQSRTEIERMRTYWAGQTARAHEAGYSEGWESALSRIHETPASRNKQAA